MLKAFRPLAADLLSTLFFVVLINLTHDVILATAVSMAVGVGQIAWLKWRRQPVAALQWMSLVLIVGLSAVSLLTRDPRFVMIKPTIVYGVIGLVMLKRGWMTRYMPEVVMQHRPDLPVLFGYIWAAMMFATAALNALVAWTMGAAAWSIFMAVFPIASKLILFAIQYGVTRVVVRRTAIEAGRAPLEAAA